MSLEEITGYTEEQLRDALRDFENSKYASLVSYVINNCRDGSSLRFNRQKLHPHP
jgi:hypothetical protein